MSARCLLALIAAAAIAPMPGRAEEPADDGFARLEARLCSQFDVCDPPCGTAASEAETSAAADH